MAGLEGIREDLDSGRLVIPSDSEYEDIHSFVEGTLTERIGEAGKRLHTGRSRNDQVALDMKLYTRDEIDEMDVLVKELLKELLVIMEANTETFMPGFTHLQKAQPVTLAHHVGAYFEMFSRDPFTGYPQENELLSTRLRRPGWNYLSSGQRVYCKASGF